jgi:peptidyl-Asp metalloendopeptidase
MFKHARLASIVLGLLVAAGCARDPEAAPDQGMPTVATASAAGMVSSLRAAPRGFADLPDRGELAAYVPGAVRRDGAYTWHRTALSEAHALRAVADGHLRITTPAGQMLDVRYDRHVEHGSGDWTWIGHVEGHPEQQTILTFGADAAFGTIAQPSGLPLRLTVRDRASWMVETDASKVALIRNAATRPGRPDYKVPPKLTGVTNAPGAPSMAGAQTAPAAIAAGTTVDLVLGYTPAFASEIGGTSAAVTRLNFLVDVTNAAYTNSGIDAKVRLVATVPVSYADATSNDDVLEKLTGYNSTTNTRTTPDPAFNGLRAARETYGADLVSMVRSYRDPENGGCGIAWLIGGGQSGIATSDSYFGYSVVSDGTDQGSDGKTYYCLDETLAHELGHNMGAAHDVETSKGDDGTLDADDYGAFSYSFGYKTTATTGNFYTVMAYGDSGQHLYRIFSNPRSTFCGSRVCGTTTQADNARTLTQTIPTVATFRATVVQTPGTAIRDFNADGRSDLLWHNGTTGESAIWRSADQSAKQVLPVVAETQWKVAAVADFNGDGRADILWRNATSGENTIWRSGDKNTRQAVSGVTDTAWKVASAGDFNGDGKDDILWRNAQTGANVVWRSAVKATRQTLATVADVRWIVAAVADFNGDGRDDILWRHTASGADTIWRSGDRNTPQAVTSVTDTTWFIAGAGDFDGNGRADVLWRNRNTGANSLWLAASASSKRILGAIGVAWTPAAIGDYDGDGQADVFWRNLSTGANVIWFSASSADTRTEGTVTSQAWQVAY